MNTKTDGRTLKVERRPNFSPLKSLLAFPFSLPSFNLLAACEDSYIARLIAFPVPGARAVEARSIVSGRSIRNLTFHSSKQRKRRRPNRRLYCSDLRLLRDLLLKIRVGTFRKVRLRLRRALHSSFFCGNSISEFGLNFSPPGSSSEPDHAALTFCQNRAGVHPP